MNLLAFTLIALFAATTALAAIPVKTPNPDLQKSSECLMCNWKTERMVPDYFKGRACEVQILDERGEAWNKATINNHEKTATLVFENTARPKIKAVTTPLPQGLATVLEDQARKILWDLKYGRNLASGKCKPIADLYLPSTNERLIMCSNRKEHVERFETFLKGLKSLKKS